MALSRVPGGLHVSKSTGHFKVLFPSDFSEALTLLPTPSFLGHLPPLPPVTCPVQVFLLNLWRHLYRLTGLGAPQVRSSAPSLGDLICPWPSSPIHMWIIYKCESPPKTSLSSSTPYTQLPAQHLLLNVSKAPQTAPVHSRTVAFSYHGGLLPVFRPGQWHHCPSSCTSKRLRVTVGGSLHSCSTVNPSLQQVSFPPQLASGPTPLSPAPPPWPPDRSRSHPAQSICHATTLMTSHIRILTSLKTLCWFSVAFEIISQICDMALETCGCPRPPSCLIAHPHPPPCSLGSSHTAPGPLSSWSSLCSVPPQS